MVIQLLRERNITLSKRHCMSWMLKIENVSKMYRLGMIDSSTIQDDLKAFYYKLSGKENPI